MEGSFLIVIVKRSSHRKCSVKKDALNKKTPVLESLFNKSCRPSGPKAYNVIKKRIQHRCFPVKFVIFFMISKNICER